MANKYITLKTSNENIIKQFKVIGYREFQKKMNSFNWTAGGHLDKSSGAVVSGFKFVFRVPVEVEDDTWGTKQDLVDFHALNEPNSTPSDKIILVDHYGISHTCFFMNNNLELEPLTTIIEGLYAWFIIAVELWKIPEAQSS